MVVVGIKSKNVRMVRGDIQHEFNAHRKSRIR